MKGCHMQTDPTGRYLTASTDEIALYNMVLTEALFELLAEKGVLTGEEVKARIEKVKKETTVLHRWKQ